jgi:hypothetical protein
MKQISAPRQRMARTLLPLLGLLLWALSVPASAPAQGADIYGVGGGKGDLGGIEFFTFDLSAHTGPNGDFGHVGGTVEGPAGDEVSYWIDVDCVSVNTAFVPIPSATIGGIVKRASPTPNTFGINVGDRVLVIAEDGGNPSARPVDSFSPPQPASGASDLCKFVAAHVSPADVTQGNIVLKTP